MENAGTTRKRSLASSPQLHLFFGLGQCSRSLIWCVTDLLIGYHLVARLGISGQLAGIILFITFLISALPDLFIANWVARRSNPLAIALRLQASFGVASLLAGLLLFAPAPTEGSWTIVYICAVSMVFRLAYAVFDVSQNALISLLPETREAVRSYVVNKTFSSSVGRLASSLLVFLALEAPTDRWADFKALAIVIVPVVVGVTGLAVVPSARVHDLPVNLPFRWRSLPLRRLAMPIVATAMEIGLLGLLGRLLPLFGNGRAGSADGASLVVAMVCGTVVGPWLSYVGTSTLLRQNSTSVLPTVLALAGTVSAIALLFPTAPLISLGLAFAYGGAVSALTNLIWERVAMIAADEAENGGARIDAPAFALITTCIKVAIAISSALFGVVVDGFRGGADWSTTVVIAVVALGGVGTAVALSWGDSPRSPRRPGSHVPRNAPTSANVDGET